MERVASGMLWKWPLLFALSHVASTTTHPFKLSHKTQVHTALWRLNANSVRLHPLLDLMKHGVLVGAVWGESLPHNGRPSVTRRWAGRCTLCSSCLWIALGLLLLTSSAKRRKEILATTYILLDSRAAALETAFINETRWLKSYVCKIY